MKTNKENGMVRRRSPGAGRKPQGEFRGKSATLTTRITPETRAALERAAKKSSRSLSQEVEARLNLSLRKQRTIDRRHIRALGEAVMLTTLYIERATKKAWNEDAFTGQAVRQGCDSLISHFAPRGMPKTPFSIAEAAAGKSGGEAGDANLVANGVGSTEAGKVISMIESWGYRAIDEVERANELIAASHFPGEWYAHEQLFRELGSGWKRVQAKEKRR
jgi:hypothetical protein